MLEFKSLQAFVLATRYNLYRVLICGLVQTLIKLGSHSNEFDIAAVEQEDVAAATAIAMCLPYALKPTVSRPLTALAMIIPLQLSLGTWTRLQQRHSAGTVEHQQATRTIDWSIENTNDLMLMWHSKLITLERMAMLCNMCAGGPLLEWIYD